ncbi:MAG: hypothetical protein KTR31_29090 [Myxococcales bacterium]|nr:hypothetical protein [Myxococcales bacterium]
MGTLEIHTTTGSVRRPLATTTLLGRHLACTWQVPSPHAPLFWVELRWRRRWSWRPLAGDEQTRGPGRIELGGWRALQRGHRILGPGDLALVLTDDAAPEPFVVDMRSMDPIEGDALDQVVEWRSSGFFPVGSEADPDFTTPLEDSQPFQSGGRLLRFHAGQGLTSTVRTPVSVQSSGCEMAVSLRPSPAVQLVDADTSVELTAEFARVAAPYVEARIHDAPLGGWLSLDEAYTRWLDLGGSTDSTRDRMAQDRSRLCRSLAKRGVGAASTLFETRREGVGWQTRVTLPADGLFLDL